MREVLKCSRVSRTFGEFAAVDNVSLSVHEGEIFGIVGPNGAGKTTLLNCLEGLDSPSSGHLEVLGLNPHEDRNSLAHKVGVQLQSAALPPRLKVSEALELYSALYPQPRPWRELMELLGIEDKSHSRIERLSGGERQRVFIALALLNHPELAFLDELTTALDPQSRRNMWSLIEKVRDEGTTVVLTTHYMEEAERLCDRVAIIDRGRIVSWHPVPQLIDSYAGDTTAELILREPPAGKLNLDSLPGVNNADLEGRELTFRGTASGLQEVFTELSAQDLTVSNMTTSTPGLEDVFLALTGRSISAEGQTV